MVQLISIAPSEQQEAKAVLFSVVATCGYRLLEMWLCNWETEFSILFNLINLNVSSHKWLVANVLDSLV